jgi:hypothetical protein
VKRPGKPNPALRGYDRRHRVLRRWFALAVARGDVVCWRCGRVIRPGQSWDLGHDDHDRSRYSGPEHAHCNRSAGARYGNSSGPSPSRDWLGAA